MVRFRYEPYQEQMGEDEWEPSGEFFQILFPTVPIVLHFQLLSGVWGNCLFPLQKRVAQIPFNLHKKKI